MAIRSGLIDSAPRIGLLLLPVDCIFVVYSSGRAKRSQQREPVVQHLENLYSSGFCASYIEMFRKKTKKGDLLTDHVLRASFPSSAEFPFYFSYNSFYLFVSLFLVVVVFVGALLCSAVLSRLVLLYWPLFPSCFLVVLFLLFAFLPSSLKQ